MEFCKILPLFLLVTLLYSCDEKLNDAMLIDNGLVYLPDGTVAQKDILLVGDKISRIEDAIDAKGATVIKAEGKFVMPGLIDAHAHFEGIGASKANLNLLGTTSWKEVIDAVEDQVNNTPEGSWIVGRGWHQDKWTDSPLRTIEGNPTHDELSAISPNHPVMLDHASGHGILVNQKAMELAGIDATTKAPEGGYMIRDENGEAIGVFQENAEQLIKDVYWGELQKRTPEEEYSDWQKLIALAEEECLQFGITTLHDAGISKQSANRFKELAEKGNLNVRLYSMLSQDAATDSLSVEELQAFHAFENPFFTCKAIKAYMDGALGSRGAWLLEPYHDKPGYFGENVTPIEDLKRTAKIAHDNNFQLCIHAIGDRGNREVIDVFEQEMQNDLTDARWRIEHAQHLHPTDINRIGGLNIIASMQTVHCTSDSPFVEKRLGEDRAEQGAYVWQSLLQNDVRIANGTDSPVESVNPLANMYAAVTRKRVGENEAFYPAQSLSRKQALDSYTIWNAYAGLRKRRREVLKLGNWQTS